MNFVDIRDHKWGFVLLGTPIQEIIDKTDWDIIKLLTEKDYHLGHLKLLVKEAEKWAGTSFDWYDTYGICNGHWWIRVSTF